MTRLSHSKKYLATAAFLALAGVLTGCKLDDATKNSTPIPGHFTATISGDVTGSMGGGAEIAISSATATTAADVALALPDSTGQVNTVVEFQGLSSLAPQTYNVAGGTGNLSVKLYVGDGSGVGGTYVATTGTVTITSVDGTNVAGTFDLHLTAADTGTNIEIAGSFQAVIISGS